MHENNRIAIIKRLATVLLTLIVQTTVFFICAGRINIPKGWLLFGLGVFILTVNMAVLPKELIAERGGYKENMKDWDKILVITGIPVYFLQYIIPGLDLRFGWTDNLPFFLNISGAVLYLAGNFLFTWAMISNLYFSTVVRIQTDRGHRVATEGPYSIIRHPGYAGYILAGFSIPLVLGTFSGFITAGINAILFIIRTDLEDKTLKKELYGYTEFAKKVKYRLFPGIW